MMVLHPLIHLHFCNDYIHRNIGCLKTVFEEWVRGMNIGTSEQQNERINNWRKQEKKMVEVIFFFQRSPKNAVSDTGRSNVMKQQECMYVCMYQARGRSYQNYWNSAAQGPHCYKSYEQRSLSSKKEIFCLNWDLKYCSSSVTRIRV